MLRLADYLLSQYGLLRITNLLNGTAIYINPNANPDGTYYSGNGFTLAGLNATTATTLT